MNEAQKKLLARAIADLVMLKCEFAVIDSEGNTHGELPITKPKDPVNRYNFRHTGYADVVDAMEVGDQYVFVCPYPGNVEARGRYAGSIASRSIRSHGVGSMTCTIRGDDIVAQRIK